MDKKKNKHSNHKNVGHERIARAYFDREHKQERKQHRKDSRQQFLQEASSNLNQVSKAKKRIAMLKFMLLLVIILVIPIVLYIMYRNTLFNSDYLWSLPQKLRAHRATAFLALIGLQIIQIIICIIPGQPIQFASSYLYGFWGGYLITIIGALIGCMITFGLSDLLGRDAMHLIFGEEKVREYIHKLNSSRAYTLIFLFYLIPGIPKDMVSYIAGISDVRLKPFLILSTIGRTPGVMESLLVGFFVKQHNYIGVAIVSVFSVVFFIVCIHYREKIMNWIARLEHENVDTMPEE